MTCNISEIRKQLADMQALMEAHEKRHKETVSTKCTKEDIKLIISETKAACREKIMELPARNITRRQAILAIEAVK